MNQCTHSSSANPIHRYLWVFTLVFASFTQQIFAQTKPDYPLGTGDSIRIQVFQNPDLTIDTRVAESGAITYPLIGSIDLDGLSISAAEKKIADALQQGGYIQQPQVNISILQLRSNQVSVFGSVNISGRFPLESTDTRLTDMLARAGGISPSGEDSVFLTGTRDGQPFHKRIDIVRMFLENNRDDNVILQGGDTIFVQRAPVFYIYGEAQRPGSFRIERGMTIMQAMALGGGPTIRGSENRLRLHRARTDGSIEKIDPKLTDLVQTNDVIYIKESLF